MFQFLKFLKISVHKLFELPPLFRFSVPDHLFSLFITNNSFPLLLLLFFFSLKYPFLDLPMLMEISLSPALNSPSLMTFAHIQPASLLFQFSGWIKINTDGVVNGSWEIFRNYSEAFQGVSLLNLYASSMLLKLSSWLLLQQLNFLIELFSCLKIVNQLLSCNRMVPWWFLAQWDAAIYFLSQQNHLYSSSLIIVTQTLL